MSELRSGDRFGRYVIERELGRGGMGAVFPARDEQLRRRVAIVPQPRARALQAAEPYVARWADRAAGATGYPELVEPERHRRMCAGLNWLDPARRTWPRRLWRATETVV